MRVIFTRQFTYDFRPVRAVAQTFEPSPEPQTVKSIIGKAAIASGAAHAVKAAKTDT